MMRHLLSGALAAAVFRGAAVCAGAEVLAVSPLVHGRALEPHLSFSAHLNVLFEARERLRAGAWGPDIAGRARRALDHLPRYGRVPRYLGQPLDGTLRMLESRRRPPRSSRALETLLERCARLG